MDTDEDRLYALAEMNLDSLAMGEAAKERDYDEVRFRASRIQSVASEHGLDDVVNAAAQLGLLLGKPGTRPAPSYAVMLVRLGHLLAP